MSARRFLLFLLQLFGWLYSSASQHSGYSLQAAVDELHRREAAKYPLNAPPPTQQRFGGGAFLGSSPQEQDYWDEDPDPGSSNSGTTGSNNRNRHKLNKILAKYLERERYDDDHGVLSLGPFGGYEFDEDDNNLFFNSPEEKKRTSYFRERDNKWSNDNSPSTVFRERETAAANGADHAELTDQFLREIEESQELEREARYKDALRRLWEKYQQQENELDGNLHEEYKRMIANPKFYMGPLMQKKRSYPVLPWLPYTSRKKRVPSAPKAPVKRSSNENSNLGKTDEKVAWELNELFGGSSVEEEKKKRSTDEQISKASESDTRRAEKPIGSNAISESTTATQKDANPSTRSDNSQHVQQEQNAQQHLDGHHAHHEQRKRSNNHHIHEDSHEECDESNEHDDRDDHDDQFHHDGHSEHHEHQEDEDEDEHEHEVGNNEENEDDEPKKKRDIKRSSEQHRHGEINKIGQTLANEPTTLNLRRKKSIEWPKYVGLDRKKKTGPGAEADALKKRSTNNNDDNEYEEKRDFDPNKLDNMDRKLQAIEDLIIDDTIKYTGAHEGIANPDEIRRLKDHVLSRLATAYSLEKMRRALEKLRQSVDKENHLLRNVIENESRSEESEILEQKRLSVKKEKVQYENQHLTDPERVEKSKEIHSNAMSSANNNDNDDNADSDEDDLKKKKKKRNNSYLRFPELRNDFSVLEPELGGVGHYESLNDAYLGNKNYIFGSNQCPLIESMAERCRNVDLLTGDIHNELLPICGVHQICYLCGTSHASCDYQYLLEANNICGRNGDCQAAAHSALMVLRGTPGPQLGPKQCLKNACLYSAMREIGL